MSDIPLNIQSQIVSLWNRSNTLAENIERSSDETTLSYYNIYLEGVAWGFTSYRHYAQPKMTEAAAERTLDVMEDAFWIMMCIEDHSAGNRNEWDHTASRLIRPDYR